MKTITLDDAQARLPELIDSLAEGEDVIIVRGEKPVAKLTLSDGRPSLAAIKPVSVGSVLRPIDGDDDLLEEMVDG